MAQNKILSLIGLATKAGATASGEYSAEKAIKEGKARLVIIGEDASENTRKHFTDMCNYRDIPYVVYGEKEQLGHAMGKEMRVVLAVTNQGLAKSLRNELIQTGNDKTEAGEWRK